MRSRGAGAGDRVAALTFDDGDPSVVDLALPLLEGLGVRGTAFVPTAEEGRLDLARLVAAEWEVGSHGHRHVELTSLEERELERELRISHELLAAQVGSCTSIAYPYSAADRRVVASARRVGFVVGFTTATTPAALDPLAWPRVGLGYPDGAVAFRVKTSRLGRWVRRSPLGAPVARAARSARRGTHGLRHR